jgi:hypothetical protein
MDLITIPRQFGTSLYQSLKRPHQFADVKTYVIFIGYPRSGHTLVGFLLDAHPNVMIASQTTAFRYLRHGFSMQQTLHILADNSARIAAAGRENRRYSYAVPNQWQGRVDKLRVIGESTGLTRLRRQPQLLQSLRERLAAIDLKLIHVIRNPYDNISTMKMRRDETLPDAITRYFSMCDVIDQFKNYVEPRAIYDLRHEHLIGDAGDTLDKLCDFVGLTTDAGYRKDCASIIFKSPHKSRHEVAWTAEAIDTVKRQMAKFPHLHGYNYED